MNMNHVQRMILSNQYEIMSKLNPENSAYFQRCKTIVERGYCLEMLELEKEFGHLTADTCKEILDTLEMHHAMKVSYENLPDIDRAEIAFNRIEFNGYARAYEKELADYVCFILDDEKRFADLDKQGSSLNSEIAMQDKYQRMLTVWRDCPRQYKLSIQEIRNIINA